MPERRITLVVGTRPEALKLAPVALALRERPEFQVSLLSTGQHREMLAQALDSFGLRPDTDLGVMRPGQSLEDLTAVTLRACSTAFAGEMSDLVVVQGDTTTAFAAGLAAHYAKVPLAHVEAGLRTGQRYNPFPEEMNRRLLADLAALHFAPTQRAARNLQREGIAPDRIFVTGNTIVDALHHVRARSDGNVSDAVRRLVTESAGRLVLVTCHRRESLGVDLAAIVDGIARSAAAFPDRRFYLPMHLNPQVRAQIVPQLSSIANVTLAEPIAYAELLQVLAASELVITDSGGIQEEAPAFGVPAIVLRRFTERPEGMSAGFARLVPPDADAITRQVSNWLRRNRRKALSTRVNPYGDGHAAERIAAHLVEYFR